MRQIILLDLIRRSFCVGIDIFSTIVHSSFSRLRNIVIFFCLILSVSQVLTSALMPAQEFTESGPDSEALSRPINLAFYSGGSLCIKGDIQDEKGAIIHSFGAGISRWASRQYCGSVCFSPWNSQKKNL